GAGPRRRRRGAGGPPGELRAVARPEQRHAVRRLRPPAGYGPRAGSRSRPAGLSRRRAGRRRSRGGRAGVAAAAGRPVAAGGRPADLEDWLVAHHPYWTGEAVRPSARRPWVEAFLLGLAYQLRLVQAARDGEGAWHVRLSPLGRWLLGLAEAPAAAAPYTQTL